MIMMKLVLLVLFCINMELVMCQSALRPGLNFDQRIGKHRQVVFPHYPGKCTSIKHKGRRLHGAEDMVSTKDGLVFISSGWSRDVSSGDRGMYMLNFSQPITEDSLKKLEIENDPFNYGIIPLGIHLFETDNNILLYVVHDVSQPDGGSIAKLRYNPKDGSLYFIKMIKDPLMTAPNDIVVVAEDQFYFTNDVSTTHRSYVLDVTFNTGLWNALGFYDGQSAKAVAGGFYGNGISISKDKRYLYASNMYERSLLVYKRLPDNGLQLIQDYFLDSFADNHIIDKKGSIWIGALPNLVEVLQGKSWAEAVIPPQILKVKINLRTGKVDSVQEVLAGVSDELPSETTVALPHPNGRSMLVGTGGHQLHYCKLKSF